MRRLALTLVTALVLAGCGYGDDQASSTFAKATVLIETDDGSKLLTVEVAENSEQRGQGLMNARRCRPTQAWSSCFSNPRVAGSG